MFRFTPLLATAALIAVQVGCSDAASVVQPKSAAGSRSELRTAEVGVQRIDVIDHCDPATFNAVLGAGTCTKAGGITFNRFIDQLTKHKTIDAWRFSPAVVQGRVGQTLLAVNTGGEVHTFTEVAKFGGGINPVLNQLTGNLEVAPECKVLASGDFIPPGGTDSNDKVANGTELYQCCIHPWMRTVVHGH